MRVRWCCFLEGRPGRAARGSGPSRRTTQAGRDLVSLGGVSIRQDLDSGSGRLALRRCRSCSVCSRRDPKPSERLPPRNRTSAHHRGPPRCQPPLVAISSLNFWSNTMAVSKDDILAAISKCRHAGRRASGHGKEFWRDCCRSSLLLLRVPPPLPRPVSADRGHGHPQEYPAAKVAHQGRSRNDGPRLKEAKDCRSVPGKMKEGVNKPIPTA